MNSLSNASPNVQIICQPNVWSYRKIAAVSVAGAVALAAIAAGIFLEGTGPISIAMFSTGSVIGLLDTAVCIHSFWKLRQFYQAVKSYEIHYPFEQFKEAGRAFDYTPFLDNGRSYTVMYVKNDENAFCAFFFFSNDYFMQRVNQIRNTHQWVTIEDLTAAPSETLS